MTLLLSIFILAVFASSVANCDPINGDINKAWSEFMITYAKKYKNSTDHDYRKQVFIDNMKRIEKHNNDDTTDFEVGFNRFSDMTPEEFRKTMSGNVQTVSSLAAAAEKPVHFSSLSAPSATLPSSIDWRTLGGVTEVKDQGPCSSCWAFSATGGLEGQMFRKTSKLVSLSEQNLVDCLYSFGGCNGGASDDSYRFIQKQGGIDTSASYPYTHVTEKCKFNKMNVAANVTGINFIAKGDENALLQAVANIGPIPVSLDTSWSSFQNYKSGVLRQQYCSTTELNHAVLVVGYGTLSGTPYWLIKNSWGTSWGMSGYMMLARNAGNMCGVASRALYPLV